MLVPGAVVAEVALAHRVFGVLERYGRAAGYARAIRRGFEPVQRNARISFRAIRDRVERVAVCLHPSDPALDVVDCPVEDRSDVGLGEGVKAEQYGSREQGADDAEERRLGGRADEDDPARFDTGQQDILLRLVEAVDLVDEQDRTATRRFKPLTPFFDDPPHVGDAGRHRRQLDELRGRVPCDQHRQRRLPGSRRPDEHHRPELVLLDQRPKNAAPFQQMRLTDEFIQGSGPHPRGERRLFGGHFGGRPARALREQRRSLRGLLPGCHDGSGRRPRIFS